jgi:hypothetical protein
MRELGWNGALACVVWIGLSSACGCVSQVPIGADRDSGATSDAASHADAGNPLAPDAGGGRDAGDPQEPDAGDPLRPDAGDPQDPDAGQEPGDVCGGFRGAICPRNQFCYYTLEAYCGFADATGVCRPIPDETCTEEHAPVCGCDGETYTNECFANAAGYSIQHVGPCEGG